ncbi:zinc finger CCCH domain-containing protein 32-like isoform X2 [Amaranthus tricolor]|uniref:zinc finger CCCH domain-containing protein 32-like isoform X2 n=1 Tax=Amaranthus tricolor TaxID=29722 RepID=UPI0025889F93|nr:zinc finger CCCH domain-containing protein 32-like isoform X2 [Amaranthus tricolor]
MESDGSHSDPTPDSDTQRPLTVLEESMGQLRLENSDAYPERPGAPDCIYFLRTGVCSYGDRCRFNHPPDRSPPPVVGSGNGGGGDFPERDGQPICQYYMRTGTCRYGTSCKYHHPRQEASPVSHFALNVYGYPLRPECAYYIKTGQCKFGMTCKFHHPPPSTVPLQTATQTAVPPAPLASPNVYSTPTAAPQPYGVVSGNWSVAGPSMVPGSYIQGPYGPMIFSSGVVPLTAWGPYSGTTPLTNLNTQSVGAGQFYGFMPLSPSAPAYAGPYQALSSGGPSNVSKEHSYPQRPGQPECQHYLKTGDCKFGSSCKYHHPVQWGAPETSTALSAMGLPLRPGIPTCSYYAQHRVCKFGPTCKYDHPMETLSYSPSTSSLSDIPVAPYRVGSSIGTLAPSSSSSDFRAELMSGSNKDIVTTLSPSVSIPSSSAGSVSSTSGSISQSNPQQSSQSSASAIITSSKGDAGHVGARS